MRKRTAVATVICGATALIAAAVAFAQADHRNVQILDNCDPASFNAAIGPGTCVRTGGGLAFPRFIAQVSSKGGASSWQFSPAQLKLAAGGTITATNRGGEFHTFTEVASFGGGCIAPLNALLGLTPVAECSIPGILGATGVPPGTSATRGPLAAGIHRLQCLIHPWQRTTAVVS
jgi:plastocyanin